MSNRKLTEVLPEDVTYEHSKDHSEEYQALLNRTNQVFNDFFATATDEQIGQARVAIDRFRNDFSCGKAIKINVNGRTVYEAYDAAEKTLQYLLAQSG